MLGRWCTSRWRRFQWSFSGHVQLCPQLNGRKHKKSETELVLAAMVCQSIAPPWPSNTCLATTGSTGGCP